MLRIRLSADMWVAALIRRAETQGAMAYVMQKGAAEAGSVLVKVASLNGEACLYRPAPDMGGDRIWLKEGPMEEREVDRRLSRQKDFDPDLWIIEIEDKQGRHFLTEEIREQD